MKLLIWNFLHLLLDLLILHTCFKFNVFCFLITFGTNHHDQRYIHGIAELKGDSRKDSIFFIMVSQSFFTNLFSILFLYGLSYV